MFTYATNKFWSYVESGLADTDGFKICLQVCAWLGLRPLIIIWVSYLLNSYSKNTKASLVGFVRSYLNLHTAVLACFGVNESLCRAFVIEKPFAALCFKMMGSSITV